ncbi:CRISPR-associated helicase Cas3' [Streptomyces sp. P38-E01]|uniref:CRISPR-associated helicase Cas3 n=1 Tax=Streptomyces tardus TaxID=2780544 RepID=A0A949JHI3_9ACTN|nr:CRISPR-associated helicase Cas3' [Streptomyces tardus]MBU7600236.1 CRISPR-associated helicase Cas3' [Streptomyces tardus]
MASDSLDRPATPHGLTGIRAKSTPKQDPERLTTHSRIVHQAVGQIEERVASAGILATEPAFWTRVRLAALLHDTGKIAEGFQEQIRPGGQRWGERHEVLSLAYVDIFALAASWTDQDRLMVATLVATHHRALHPSYGSATGSKLSLAQMYNQRTNWPEAFTSTPRSGGDQTQVPRRRHCELVAWLSGALGTDPPPEPQDAPTLAERSRRLLEHLLDVWRSPVKANHGLLAVLAQGALTLADHAGSAHERLQTHIPLPFDYLERLAYVPYEHQRHAAEADSHLVLVAPTGSGKTEAGLAWAARRLAVMPGLPRVVWTLPYRASLNAVRRRFERDLIAAPGDDVPDIGLLHGTVAHTLLNQAVEDDCPSSDSGEEQRAAPSATMARQARARANAMRLFTQRLRVATPHQLLRAAIAGPAHSSTLLEQANSLFVLDELHAYEPATFGRLCAAMALWERLGSRTAVLSATLAPPMVDLIDDSLKQRVTIHRAPQGTSPVRHRLVLDEDALTSPSSVDRLRSWLGEGHSVLAVTNTVAVAQQLFTELSRTAREGQPADPYAALLLHSRFKNRDRDAIESNLLTRHPERRAKEKPRRGGLVVATQTVEVSLQLDFDRGAVEVAPIEAVAQRAGRVNRRGRHPDGAVEFRVHRGDSHRPYEAAAVDAAWLALNTLVKEGIETLSEHDIDRLLQIAYDTAWGQKWADEARDARDAFATTFLTFTDPFHDRTEFAEKLSEQFDGVDVLHSEDVDEYRELNDSKGDPLLAVGLLIPLSRGLLARYNARFDRTLNVHVIDGEYDAPMGLRPPPEPETIL